MTPPQHGRTARTADTIGHSAAWEDPARGAASEQCQRLGEHTTVTSPSRRSRGEGFDVGGKN